jgi:hypothetical protein
MAAVANLGCLTQLPRIILGYILCFSINLEDLAGSKSALLVIRSPLHPSWWHGLPCGAIIHELHDLKNGWDQRCGLCLNLVSHVGHSYMYLITHLQRKGIYHGAIYLRNWSSLHPISTDKSKFCHFR